MASIAFRGSGGSHVFGEDPSLSSIGGTPLTAIRLILSFIPLPTRVSAPSSFPVGAVKRAVDHDFALRPLT